jgi:membrane metallo-endopeptidase-like protein 1
LNGAQTQGENIADNGGLRESFKAYKRWEAKNGKEKLLPGLNYTQDQLFFINYGQIWCSKFKDAALINRIRTGVHSPGEFR